jgi:hypothetical protein
MVREVTARLLNFKINLFILFRIFVFVCFEGQKKHLYVSCWQNAEGLCAKAPVYKQPQGLKFKIHVTKPNLNLLKCLKFSLVLCLTWLIRYSKQPSSVYYLSVLF